MRVLMSMLLAAAAPASGERMSEAEMSAVQTALDRGALMYAYDQAAWHGTDDLEAKARPLVARSGGWIVDGPAESPELVFIDTDADHPHALFVVDFRDGRLVSDHVVAPADAALTPERLRLVAALRSARAAVAAASIRPCAAKPFNTVVLPPANPSAPTSVYFLTPQIVTGSIPLGGHYRVEVARDGTAGSIHAFTKACAELPISAKDSKPVQGLGITHLLDPTPTEVHVFSSLAIHLPIYVVTTMNKHLWAVEGSRIRLVPPK